MTFINTLYTFELRDKTGTNAIYFDVKALIKAGEAFYFVIDPDTDKAVSKGYKRTRDARKFAEAWLQEKRA